MFEIRCSEDATLSKFILAVASATGTALPLVREATLTTLATMSDCHVGSGIVSWDRTMGQVLFQSN